jgi:DNA-binding transcriptional ArsR family regulator
VTKITLDAETFKALASATRLTVLKALAERRKTLTEIAKDLELNKATVHEHLQLLTAAGLVRKRDDEGRKWIYYELTWTGERILHPEATTTFSVLLGLSVAAAGGGFVMLGRALGWWLQDRQAASQPDGSDDARSLMQDSEADQGPQSAQGSTSGSEEASDSTALKVEDDALRDSAPGADGGLDFFGDGGWLAIALLVTMALFVTLAFFLRRKFGPKSFDPDAAAAAGEGGGNASG